MKSETLLVHGLQTHINVWGDPAKPKLFFVHGFMDSGAGFQFTAEHLIQNYYCIAPDLRGFGRTGWTPNPLGYYYFEYIADLHEIFRHYSPNEPIKAVGHSMGGNIVSLYAGTFPERVSHFVNIEGFGINDMPPETGPGRLQQWIEGMKSFSFPVHLSVESLSERLQKSNPRLPKDRALFLAREISQDVPGGVRVRFDPKHRWVHPYLYQLKNVETFWKRITAKCLFVMGEKTDWGGRVSKEAEFLKEVDRRLADYPKDSKRVTLKECGHMLHHENPQALAEAVSQFLV